jgi:UDP-N-acetylmuramoylalanine--D-glutamate ligase
MDALTGKRIVILGMARQGKALARFAAEVGAKVVVSDLRPVEKLQDSVDELAEFEIEYVLGTHPMSLLNGTDVLAISGGVAADSPLIEAARAQGIRLTNDSLEFMQRTPAAVIGITGSAGKTTTTALTGVMGQLAGRRTWVGGNIGRPLIADLHKMDEGDMVVQELSSFQLEVWGESEEPCVCPQVAAVLNITPNHLDRHKTMDMYTAAKANLLRFQPADGVAVLCRDDEGSKSLKETVRGRLRWFSAERPVKDGAFVHREQIWISRGDDNGQKICDVSEIKLRGRHNILNVLAAVTLADSVDIPVEAIYRAVTTFTGVEHRLEPVATVNEVQYINDSIATAPERAMAALNSFSEPLVLLAGGRDKDLVWEEWAKAVVARVKAVVLFGELAGLLQSVLTKAADSSGQRPTIVRVATLAEAVAAGAALARPGDVVLLSPGGTSFDAFADFAQRGELFRQLVQEMGTR